MLIAGSLLASQVFAQGTAVITGTVVDASNENPIADVVVTATSPGLQGEQVVLTDATGTYRLPQLPSGLYTLRYEKEGFKPFSRSDITLRQDVTVRVNVKIMPSELQETIEVIGTAPTIDVGSSSTGVNVSSDFIKNIAVVNPGARGGAVRSFESLAVIAPGAHADLYGVSISGTTSPENQYVIDGMSVNDPGFGLNATPLTVEFVQEVNVMSGGYMPEYGRATGGVMSVVTKQGSNEFHGSVWGNITPGGLEGDLNVCEGDAKWGIACGREVKRAGTVINTRERLWNLGDMGAELGGPILKDRLWFYAGFAPSFTRYRLTRTINTLDYEIDPATGAGVAVLDESGYQSSTLIPGTEKGYFADGRSFQYIGKLTYLISQDHSLSLSVFGTPASSGGEGRFATDLQAGGAAVGNIVGPFETMASRQSADSMDVTLKLASSFMDKRLLFDTTAGWHHQTASSLPYDGSQPGETDPSTLAGTPLIRMQRNRAPGYHTLADYQRFENLSPEQLARCAPVGGRDPCAVQLYYFGGAGFIGNDVLDRFQGKTVATYLLTALGHHVFKAGIDVEYMTFDREKAYTGGVYYSEHTSGAYFYDLRQFGFPTGPDQDLQLKSQSTSSASLTYGGFVQDSWNLLDLVTINAGVRYDTQNLYGNNRQDLVMQLANQISPRIGVIYDFTQQGRSKVFANYARFFENALLDMIDRGWGDRSYGAYRYRTASAATGRPGCDPMNDPNYITNCRDPRNLVTLNNPDDPTQKFYITGGDVSPVDAALRPQSTDEIVVGAEYEVFTDARAGLTYTKRYMNSVIEDMSRDEATTYFIGNPGEGMASDFPRATRDYDAVTIHLNKNFSDLWLAQASYTWSQLIGNYAGLFRPETGQLDPNINSDFDLQSLLPNRTGPLPGDRTHSIKLFGAKEFVFGGNMSMNLGLTYTLRSGAPRNYLGSHEIYGTGESFLLPRGSDTRLPWINNVDTHLGFNYRISKDSVASVSVDVFNLFNFQQVAGTDQLFTRDAYAPIENGTEADLEQLVADGVISKNPNFGRATAYQAARSIRFGAKVTF